MKTLKTLTLLALCFLVTAGAERCEQEPEPVPPEIKGSWLVDCGQTEDGLLFADFRHEYTQFSEDLSWLAMSTTGTFVEEANGTFEYEGFELKIYADTGELYHTYTVEQDESGMIRLTEGDYVCELTESLMPTKFSGPHPTPQGYQLEVKLYVNDQLEAQKIVAPSFSNYYQWPQVQSMILETSSYSIGHATLNIASNGDQLEHYASLFQIYSNSDMSLIDRSYGQIIELDKDYILSTTSTSGDKIDLISKYTLF
jgi:hypothetical protein